MKAASEIYTPVSGKVVQLNVKLEDKPGLTIVLAPQSTNVLRIRGLVNSSCYDEGWLFKLELSKPNELGQLMNEQQYAEFVKKAKE